MLTLSTELESVNVKTCRAVLGYQGMLTFQFFCPHYHKIDYWLFFPLIPGHELQAMLSDFASEIVLYFPSFIHCCSHPSFPTLLHPPEVIFSVLPWEKKLYLLPQDVVGCNISPVDGFQSRDESLSYLCNVVSKEDGSFRFLSLPSGKYTVVSSQKVKCLSLHWVVNFHFLNQVMHNFVAVKTKIVEMDEIIGIGTSSLKHMTVRQVAVIGLSCVVSEEGLICKQALSDLNTLGSHRTTPGGCWATGRFLAAATSSPSSSLFLFCLFSLLWLSSAGAWLSVHCLE